MITPATENSASPSAAYNAAHNGVVLFDLSDRTQIEITGADRVRFLHGFTTNNIQRLKPGQGCETFVTNLKGKVVAHVYVFCGENSLWLDGTPGQQKAVLGHLGKYVLIDDVQLVPQDNIRGELYVTGPLAAQLLQLEAGPTLCGQVTRETFGESFDIRRVDLLGHPGFLLSIPLTQVARVKLSMTALGVIEGTRELFEFLRIEAGFPQYGADITDDNLAQEVARTKSCISFDKGCYLGQETVARLDAMGHTNRELRRCAFETDLVPAIGSPVFDADGIAEVGNITSVAKDDFREAAALSPRVVALGQIKRASLQPDTVITVKVEDRTVQGRVLGTSFS